MERITIDDFKRHGFKVEILHKAEDDTEDDLIVLTKGSIYFKVELSPEGSYIMPLFDYDFTESQKLKMTTIWAEKVSDFSDLIFKFAKIFKDVSHIYYCKQMFAQMISDELSKVGIEAK